MAIAGSSRIVSFALQGAALGLVGMALVGRAALALTPTPTPGDVGITAQVGNGSGAPGMTIPIDVRLQSNGVAVTSVVQGLGFGPYAVVADRGGGVPDCVPGPALLAASAQFVFAPSGCTTTQSCTEVWASITSIDPIPDGSVAYRCMVLLTDVESPPNESCAHTLRCIPGAAVTSSGAAFDILCPLGADGVASADFALTPLSFAFSADPADPVVGDDVTVTFTVEGNGGLPRYDLYGAVPIFSGTFSLSPGGPLGEVSFPLHAEQHGAARLSVDVDYETAAGCPGHEFFYFTGGSSPSFPIVVSDGTPGPITPAGSRTITPTPTPSCGTHCISPSISPTPTASCGPTGTPFCAGQCFPCPTIRENCPAFACGLCIQNPTCADDEVCAPRGGGPPYNCCECATPTPHGTDIPPPTPPPTVVTDVSGVVYDSSKGVGATIADAEISYTYGSNSAGGSVRSDADGRYHFSLPSDVSAFTLDVIADGYFRSDASYAVADLGSALDIGLSPDGCASAAAITIDPDSGPVGSTVKVSGECYFIHSGRQGTIYFDEEVVAMIRGDTDGGYETTFTVPATTSGRHLVSLRADTEQFGVKTFTVVPFCTGQCPCAGDCNGDHTVQVNELIRLVNVALSGEINAATCPLIGEWCSGTYDITCLLQAVGNALRGCPVAAGP